MNLKVLSRLCGAVGYCLVTAAGAGTPDVLSVERVRGSASLDHASQVAPLERKQAIREADLISVEPGSSVTLSISRYGEAELGPGAALNVAQLPFSSFADDLRTTLQLQSGYLRILWKHPATGGDWPLSVEFGGHRADLDSGEYFFQAGQPASLCIASGGAELAAENGRPPQQLGTGACYALPADGAEPQKFERAESDFIGMRQQRAIVALMPPAVAAPVAEVAPAPAPALAPAAAAVAPPVPDIALAGANDTWNVNIISDNDLDGAKAVMDRLRTSGFAAAVQSVEIKGRTWYRVCLPGYASAAQARAKAAELARATSYKNPWVTRVPAGSQQY